MVVQAVTSVEPTSSYLTGISVHVCDGLTAKERTLAIKDLQKRTPPLKGFVEICREACLRQ